MTWTLKSATTKGDVCDIVYTMPILKEDGTPALNDDGTEKKDTRKVCHYRSKDQDERAWYANIRREIGADLSDLNPVEDAPVDITARISL